MQEKLKIVFSIIFIFHLAPKGATKDWGCPRGRSCTFAHGYNDLSEEGKKNYVDTEAIEQQQRKDEQKRKYLNYSYDENTVKNAVMEGLSELRKNKRRKKSSKGNDVIKPLNEETQQQQQQEPPPPLIITTTTETTIESNPIIESEETIELNTDTMNQLSGEMSLTDSNLLEGQSTFSTLGLSVPLLCTKKLYYEVELVTDNKMQIGWATSSFECKEEENNGVGDTDNSWSYDGFNQKMYNEDEKEYGKESKWKCGDIIGCFYDGKSKEISFSRNGRSLGIAFSDIKIENDEGIYPAISLEVGQKVRINLGQKTFKYPLSDGYEDVWNILQSFKNNVVEEITKIESKSQ